MNRLKEYREEAMMTVRQLSARSGVSEDTITKIENGHRKGRSMTLRKLAKALGVKPHQLSPEQFERTAGAEESALDIVLQDGQFGSEMANANPSQNDAVEYAYAVEATVARAYEIMHAIERPAENPPPQRRYSDRVPRMNISERQQRVLITVLECGEVEPSTVADRLEISASTTYRDLSVLEEYGLVVTEESGKHIVSPLGRDLVEAILDPQNKSIVNTQNGVYYDEALSLIATLVKAYESVAGFDPQSPTGEEASFHLLQEITIQSIRRIVAAAKPPPATQTLTQKFREDLWFNSVEIEPPVDLWGVARKVWTVLSRYMGSPPSQQTIRADIEGVPPTDVLEALDMTIVAYWMGRFEVEAEGYELLYRNFLWLLKKPHRRRYPTQQREGDNRQQAERGKSNL
jgi:transcriptional regulator with XRE-family HTH domain